MPATPSDTRVESAWVLRQHFLLDPSIAFLNHGSYGACPGPVFEVAQAWQRQLEREPVQFVGRHQENLLDKARERMAQFLNADPSTITFAVNSTSAINVIARSIPLKAGDEILSTNLEYGALEYTWTYLCQKSGATFVSREIATPFTSTEAFIEAFWEGVTERTRAIFMSHITSATAATLPVKEICQRAREAGILTIIDGAHVPGQIPLDLANLGADIYAGNFHKWLCAPKGSAFLYVHPDHHDWVESHTISWGWAEPSTFVGRNQQQGTRDVSAFLATPAALDFQLEHNWDEVRRRCHHMLRELRIRVHDRLGTSPLYDDDSGWYTQMAVITLPDGDHSSLEQRLFLNHGVEVPITRHDGNTFVRVSVQGYTTGEDISRFESALALELDR